MGIAFKHSCEKSRLANRLNFFCYFSSSRKKSKGGRRGRLAEEPSVLWASLDAYPISIGIFCYFSSSKKSKAKNAEDLWENHVYYELNLTRI